ncbi:flagellar assembly protein FliX [Devosia sp.]|uniref:flagellar assembly protein FliX n=1 Tax=Devosia sp. TaxID=1871048 RepID=UPI0032631A48
MRIDGNPYTSAVNGRSSAGRAAAGAEFIPAGMQPPAKVQNTAPLSSTANIASLLSVQLVDDALHSRKKAVKRGKSLLDTLDQIKADLLLGRVGEGRLDGLMTMVNEAREQSDPELDALIDDIELRVRVELAKFGRFTD